MDDARIKALTDEVLAEIRSPGAPPGRERDLESRVAALEAAVRGLVGPATAATPTVTAVVVAASHPSHGLVGVPGGGTGQCVMEPDKPCIGSGACRTFGH